MKAAWLTALIPLWVIQYVLWVPLVWAWKVLAATTKVVATAMFLLFIPVIGWAIIIIKAIKIVTGQRSSATYLRPWGRDLLAS